MINSLIEKVNNLKNDFDTTKVASIIEDFQAYEMTFIPTPTMEQIVEDTSLIGETLMQKNFDKIIAWLEYDKKVSEMVGA